LKEENKTKIVVERKDKKVKKPQSCSLSHIFSVLGRTKMWWVPCLIQSVAAFSLVYQAGEIHYFSHNSLTSFYLSFISLIPSTI
jgi:hypothetical protein